LSRDKIVCEAHVIGVGDRVPGRPAGERERVRQLDAVGLGVAHNPPRGRSLPTGVRTVASEVRQRERGLGLDSAVVEADDPVGDAELLGILQAVGDAPRLRILRFQLAQHIDLLFRRTP